MLFSDDVRPNTYVSKVQADAICKMAVEASADTDGVVCQSITEFIANKYNLGSAPKIAYGYSSTNQSYGVSLSFSGFTSPPTFVFVPYTSSSSVPDPKPVWVHSVTTTGAVIFTNGSPWFTGVYWMAIGT